eukprot:GHRR01014995.1.p1 GENE.GHRR01014995.1~~GHRR01014995.1.p1  ORF type:complete len:133 (+),score=23.06 GHRR01014995.1:379-777(+)
MQSQKAQVLSRYKELLRLIQRLPFDKAVAAKAEAQQTIRQRRAETSPDTNLLYLKELAARISFLRMTTPRRAGEPLDSGRYILRDGELVKSTGESKGARVADGAISVDEAHRMNREHFKRFYGKPKPKEMFF